MSVIRFMLTTGVDDSRPVYLAGSFCDWYPALPQFQLQAIGLGVYCLELSADTFPAMPFEYKYTRGGWDSVELSQSGEGVSNRILRRMVGVRRDVVPHWRWNGLPFNPAWRHRVEMVDVAFVLPQLHTTRRIQVLLPHDYQKTDKHYPVLYMQDAQNLFGGGSGYGNWAIDQKLAVLAHRHRNELIIVAIDHGGRERIAEFLPHDGPLALSKGRRYVDFIAHTLKPHIDAHYRTLSDVSHTGIGGSSMGGLISLYAGVIHPQVFGRLMVFSPSLWAAPQLFDDIAHFCSTDGHRVYLYGGGKESAGMVSQLERLRDLLIQRASDEQLVSVKLSVDRKGKHNETCWGIEFPAAVEWLFFD